MTFGSSILFLRRVRGIVGTALTWALVWLPMGIVMAVYRFRHLHPHAPIPLRVILVVALAWAAWGAISGAVFASVLAVAERHRALSDLLPSRTAAWGALGAVVLPGGIFLIVALKNPSVDLIVPAAATLSISAVLGAACAAATLALARRAVPQLKGREPTAGGLSSP
jgi:cation transporter-like permease